DGIAVPLTPKTYDLLLLLIESNGRVLMKEELKKALWPDSFVDESNLTQQISTVRKVLGEAGGENRYIVTVPGKGYRFAAVVTEPVSEPTESQPPRRFPVRLGAAVALLALAAGIYLLVIWRTTGGTPRSLAILPFRSLKADPENEFLGFSLADAVIT